MAHEPAQPAMIAPGRFEQLRDGFNYKNYQRRRDEFVRCVIEAIDARPNATVLDIGCGSGIRREREPQQQIARHAAMMWGVEPDVETQPDAAIFSRIWQTTLEDADLPEASVDVAYAHMVVEHVADPQRFVRRLHRVLKPGGCAIFLTINARSYLGRFAKLAHVTGVQDWTLRLTRGGKNVESYHYPAVYRFNTARDVQRLAGDVGFSRAECAWLERGEARIYFPKALRWMGDCIDAKHRLLKQRERFTNLLIRLQR